MTGSIRCRGTAISMAAMALIAFGGSDVGHAARPSSNGIAFDRALFQVMEAPRIERAGIDRQGRLVMTGRAVPGQAVELVAGSRALGSAVTRLDGAWRIVSPEPVGEGATTFLVRGRDGGTGRTLDGDAIQLTVPRGWSGRAVTLFTRPADVPRRVAGLHPTVPADARASATERASETSNPLRSAVSADLVRVSNDSAMMFDSAGVRYAQAVPSQTPAERPADAPYRKSSDSPFDWFFRLSDNANHRFQDVVRRIAGGETVPAPGGTGADGRGGASTAQVPPSAGVKLPVAGAPAAGAASPVVVADGSSAVLDWIERSAREYQGVIKRLSGAPDETPTQGTTAAGKAATGLAIGAAGKAAIDKAAQDKLAAEKAAVEKVVADKVVADKAAAEKAIAEKAAAEQKRLADAKAAADKAAAEKAAAEQKRLADAKAAADKAAAEKAASEQKRLADAKAAADKAAAEKAAAEQKRLADVKAAADKAAAEKAAAEQKRLADAKAAADRAAAELKALGDRASESAQRDIAAASRAADEVKKAVDAAAADRARLAAAAAKGEAELKALAERASADAQRAISVAGMAAEQVKKAADALKQAEDTKMASARAALAARTQAVAAKDAAERQKAEETIAQERRKTADAIKAQDAARRAIAAQKAAQDATTDQAKRAETARAAAQAALAALAASRSEQDRVAAALKVAETAKIARDAAERAESAIRAAEEIRARENKGAGAADASVSQRGQSAVAAASGASNASRPARVLAKSTTASQSSCRAQGKRITPPGWYVVRAGDTLSHIALRHYHDAEKYPALHRANRSRVADADLIYVCQKLWLPGRLR